MADLNDHDSSATDKSVPALIPAPKAEPSDADAFGPVIDLEAVSSASAADEPAAETIAPPPRASWCPLSMPLAAGLAFALIGGALAGAAATATFMHDSAPPATLETAEATKALQNSVAQLGSELAMLKTGVTSAQKNASTQFGKIAERLDRTEKAQAEPAGKLAKLQESVDRIEKHQQVAAAPAPAAPEITGSIAPKDEAKPQVAEGWKLRDFYDGRAIVESRNGTLFRIGAGSIVPGLGKVETIKRDNGKVIVLTANGTITGSLEPRRYYYPRW